MAIAESPVTGRQQSHHHRQQATTYNQNFYSMNHSALPTFSQPGMKNLNFSETLNCSVTIPAGKLRPQQQTARLAFRLSVKTLMVLVLLVMVAGVERGRGQQLIGSFPVMDGGFENQSGTLGTSLSGTAWSRQSGTGSAITSTSGRSGPKYVTATVSAANRILQSPQDATAANGPAANTAYRVQFFYKSSAAFNVFQFGVSINGTSSPTYSTGVTLASTSGVWTKYEGTVTTPIGTVTSAGIGIIRGGTSASGGPIDVDDFVLYAGALDNSAPSSPGAVTVNGATQTSLTVSWVAASGGVDGGGYVVVRYASNPNADNDPNQNGIYAVGNTTTNGTGSLTGTIRYIGTALTFTDNVGLSSGTQYWYKVYTADKAFNYSAESSNSGTTSSSASTSSDIIANASFTYPTNISYSSFQGTNPLTTGNSIEVAQFDIRDGGASSDADALTTTLTGITFNGTNSGSMRRIALFDGTTNVGEVAGSATATFSSLTLAAADNASKTFSIRVSFLSSVTDNQQFSFTIANATANPAGSAFAAPNAGGAVTSTTGDNNRIEVTATGIIFDQDVSTVSLGTGMSPSPTLRAVDANVNYDLDYSGSFSVSVSTGSVTFDPSATTTGSFLSGLMTLSNLKFNSAGNANQITITSGSFTDVSSSFDVTNPLPEINIKQSATNIASAGSYGFGDQLSGTSSSAITFTIENIGSADLTLTGTPKIAIGGTNASEFTVDQSSTTATVAAAGTTTFTITFSPTTQGSKTAAISIANNDATGDENPYVINLTGTGTVSAASDIVEKSGYAYPTNIAYGSYQAIDITGGSNDIEIAKFTIRDGGATTDADNLPTTLNQVVFTVGNSANIRRIALYDGATEVGTEQAGAASVTFSGLSLAAADGGTKDFSVRVSFNSSVTDNQKIQLTVAATTSAAATGSVFAATNAGGATTTLGTNDNKIAVTANHLAFVQQPTNVIVNSSVTPAVTVSADDANNNRDLDYITSVSATASGATLSGSPVSATPASGLATFSTLTFTTSGTGVTLIAASGSLTDGTSNAITVVDAPPATLASAILFSNVTVNSMTVSWTNGDGANRIVVARLSASARVGPSNGSGYACNSPSFTDGLNATTGTGNVVVYNGTGSTVNVTGLAAGIVYAFDIYEYNGSGATASYSANFTGTKTALPAEPTLQATNVSFSNISTTGFKITWTLGDGANSLVLVKDAAAVDAVPVDGTSYTANGAFGSGPQIGTGNYVVYRATTNTVTITGLTDGNVYHVAVYTYSGAAGSGNENYLTITPARGSQAATMATFYSQASGDPATLSSWNSARAGGGSAPAAFIDGNFVIQNTHTMTTTAAWSVGATGSTLEIENGGTLAANFAVTIASASTFKIDGGGTYIHNNTSSFATTIFNGTENFAATSNFEIRNYATTGPSGVTFGNLTINNTVDMGSLQCGGGITTILGSFNLQNLFAAREIRFSASTALALVISGDFIVQSGILEFASSAGSSASRAVSIGGNFNQTGGTVKCTGTSNPVTITFTGSNKTFTFSGGALTNTNINWAIGSSASLSLNNNLPVAASRSLTLSGGVIITGANKVSLVLAATISRTGGHIRGNLERFIPNASAPSVTFDIGDATSYTPVTVAFSGTTTGSGSITASTTAGDHPQIATSGIRVSKSVARYWTLTNNGVTGFTSYSPAFTFVAGDIDAGATPSAFIIRKYNSPTWTSTTLGTADALSTTATGVTSFSDFQIGELCIAPSVSGQPLATQSAWQNHAPVDLAVTAAGDGITYQWYSNASNSNTGGTSLNPAGTSNTYTPPTSATGTTYYYCVVTGDCGTATSNAAGVIVNAVQPLQATASVVSNIGCNGTSNGIVTVSATGGNLSYTYIWSTSPAQTTQGISGLSAGTYSVTVTDGFSSTATSGVTLTEPSLLTASLTAQTDVTCFGGSNGSATVTASGGAPGYSYVWNTVPAQHANVASGLSAGTYQVTVTDINSCSATVSVGITQPASLPAASVISHTDVLCHGNATGTATVSASDGTPGYTYAWSTNPVQTTEQATGLSAGTFTVTVTDGHTCTATASVEITQPASAVTVSATVTSHVLCYGNATGTATLTGSGGMSGYSFVYARATDATNNVDIFPWEIFNLSAGPYSVTVTDANSCTATTTFEITQPSAALTATIASQTNILCYGNSTGSAQVTANSGTSGYTYLWSTDPVQTADMATGLTAGTYTVTVTDANNCTATTSVGITQPAVALAASVNAHTNILCHGSATGSATVTAYDGTPGYSYAWSTDPVQTLADVSGLAAGTYTATVTDVNSCTALATVQITEPATGVSAEIIAQTNILCHGNSTGSATVQASGGGSGYSYLWNNGETGTTVSGLAAGNYTITVTDLNSCTATATAEITQPTVLSATTTHVDVSIFGASDGSATAVPAGGTAGYTYLWSNGQTAVTITGLSAGNYSVTVTDANSCTTSVSVTVNQVSSCIPGLAGQDVACRNTSGYTYTTEAGMASYTWAVSSGGTIVSGGTSSSNTIVITWTTLAPQTVSVIYTTSGGCTAHEPTVLNVTINPEPEPVITGVSTVTQGQTVTYSTPYNSGNSYTWNASHGNPELCFPNRNCLTLIWDFPCGVINPGYVKVTETIQATGCSATATEWITIIP